MLSLLKINNIALIDELQLEFSAGLNLLTGETGSGKSIIVDSLGALIGGRVSADLVKEGANNARIEGVFEVLKLPAVISLFEEAGIEFDDAPHLEIIVRRELSINGKNRIFVNNQSVTNQFLKKLGGFLGEIHGQGEQFSLFEPETHLELFDEFANVADLREKTAHAYQNFTKIRRELNELLTDETNKLQLADILKFQIDEIKKTNIQAGEDDELELERRRLANVEKLSALSADSYSILYENGEAVISQLANVVKKVEELGKYEPKFAEYRESLAGAEAVLEDLSFTLRDYQSELELSPERLSEIENRLAELSRLKRKYGNDLTIILKHLAESEEKLSNIENADERAAELRRELKKAREIYLKAAQEIHEKRTKSAPKFEKTMETALQEVALEKSRFVVKIELPPDEDRNSENLTKSFTRKGFDNLEFYFSANVGESPKPLAKVASGGEASRLMLILKTVTKSGDAEKTAVFDEIDTGISGRVAEAVGRKLKELARTNQVLCVTHQPQVASLADNHFRVEKEMTANRTIVKVLQLTKNQQVEEIARMLTGAKVTESARTHAKELLKANG